jgi:hypothetical protein
MGISQENASALAFDLEYEGPALRNHEMNVRDLAPALLATANLFQEIGRVEYPAEAPVEVTVRATEEGSFVVQLHLLFDTAVGALGSPGVTAVNNLLTMLNSGIALISLRQGRARSREMEQRHSEPGRVLVRYEDGTSLEVPEEVLRLDRNPVIRRNLTEIVRPLEHPGIESLRFRQEEIVLAEVEKRDLPAFSPGDESPVSPQTILATSKRETYLQIVTAAFKTGNRWRLSDGDSTFYTKIVDEDFLRRVEERGTVL